MLLLCRLPATLAPSITCGGCSWVLGSSYGQALALEAAPPHSYCAQHAGKLSPELRASQARHPSPAKWHPSWAGWLRPMPAELCRPGPTLGATGCPSLPACQPTSQPAVARTHRAPRQPCFPPSQEAAWAGLHMALPPVLTSHRYLSATPIWMGQGVHLPESWAYPPTGSPLLSGLPQHLPRPCPCPPTGLTAPFQGLG